jgi:hypothetical protein
MRYSRTPHANNIRRIVLAGILCLASTALSGVAEAAVTITRLSSPVFYIASNSASPAKYVVYRITNDGPGAIADAWVELGGFSPGVFSLATNEDGEYHIGFLAAGQARTAYFLLQAAGETATPQTHQVSVHAQPWDAGPPLATVTFALTCETSLAAQSISLDSWTLEPGPGEIGAVLSLVVQGETGTMGAGALFTHSPATLPTWACDGFELVGTQLTTHDQDACDFDVTGSYDDALFVQPMPDNSCYRITYTFRCARVLTDSSPTSPNIAMVSGQDMKHAANVTSAPLPPTVNRLRIEHLVGPTTLSSASTVACTVLVHNEGTSHASMDLVIADLPTSPAPVSYVPGSARLNGLHFPDPGMQGASLWFGLSPSVAPGGTLQLTFDAQVPATTGDYTFIARGKVGPFVVDATLAPIDDSPAAATVTVGPLGVDDRPPALGVLHGASPDPVRGEGAVRFTLAEETSVSLTIRDLMGRTVAVLGDRELRPAGRHSVTLAPRTLTPGVYVLCLSAGDRTFSRAMTVLR